MNKEIIIENTGRNGKQKRVLLRFVRRRIGGGAFDEEVVARDDYSLRLLLD